MSNFEDKPEIFSKDSQAKTLLQKKPYINFVDAFVRQIKELFFIDNNDFIGQSKEDVYKTPIFKKYQESKSKDYLYIYYPWNQNLVKCVKESDYFRLITNRNRDLITAGEQKKLYGYKVAVFGMSVGSNIAYVLTQAGISKNIIIADFDELDTTNLNRIWAGVHQVGLNKTIIAARRIYENNPYAEVRVLRKGINTGLLEKLLKERKIDCIVEEIDSLVMKVEVRKLAMKYKVPVLMITDNGDRAVLTIERYDLKYKKMLEKDLDYWDKRIALCRTPKDFGDIVINDIVGGVDKVDPRMVLNRELVSWPQLGSCALLGGIVTTVAIKSIVNKEDKRLFRREFINVLY